MRVLQALLARSMVENQSTMCVRLCTPTVCTPLNGDGSAAMESGLWKESKKNGERIRDEQGFRLRAAGVCLRQNGQETEVLLVSGGKDGSQWVVPGGGVERNEATDEAARRELEEEAGVRARPLESIGIFQDDNRKHRTSVYLMEILEELVEWEDGQRGRRRAWFALKASVDKVKASQSAILTAVLQR